MSIQPQLRRFDLTMIVVSLVIGVGIFRTPAMVAKSAGSEFVYYGVWVIGGIISVFGALTFAEIGARLPAAGGYYRIFSSAYHPVFAFILNWSQVIINAGSSAGVAIIGAEYITPVLISDADVATRTIPFIAIGIIIVLFALNFAGIRMGARTQNLLSILKILMILFCCCALFANHPAEVGSIQTETDWVRALGISLIAVFFTYGGYQQTVNFGADVREPKKNIPFAILTGMGIVIVLYLLINITYVQVLGFAQMKDSPLVARELVISLFGAAGGTIVSVILFTSVLGFLNTSVMSNPRVYYAMAEDKILPPIFQKVHPQKQVQEFGLTFFVTLMIASIFLLGSFEKIVNYVIFTDSISLATAAAAIFILRRRDKNVYAGFRMPGYPVLPTLFIFTLLFVAYNTLVDDLRSAGIGIIILITGWPIYYLLRMLQKKSN